MPKEIKPYHQANSSRSFKKSSTTFFIPAKLCRNLTDRTCGTEEKEATPDKKRKNGESERKNVESYNTFSLQLNAKACIQKVCFTASSVED
ncbi:hypothetical protein MSBRW_0883 [Methanosarcina barkeri str. Wiesmoor]|uniref:Uncharacterized protein n=2 Tax=Methanosarcina barkeri TaxID=2208 RepID=A0A0E3LKU6_METBA|nr:hypothetical protein [Methanosarcina barkeri]AKB50136.1 hypothetical protein MSBRW_0883 [Methanosarcina barkeri str. Wiesmoor]